MSLQHCGIFGPGQSGKTTLAKQLVKQMSARHGFSSLVLDPNREKWEGAAYCTDDEEQFWKTVWASEKCFVVAEEATETIARDKSLTRIFTRIRHNGHKLCIIGHNGTNLLPIMREQIHYLHLFRQPEASAKLWADTMAEDRLMRATSLRRYEFVRCIQFGDTATGDNLVETCKLKL